MRLTHAAAIILAMALTLIASFSVQNTAAAQTQCVQALTAATTEGSWTADCPSTNRDNAYARFYTFTLTQQTEVTITLESATDPYLFLLSGTGADADYLTENDDIDAPSRNFNSRITRTLNSGSYTIEATTYTPGLTGDFTLTTTGIDFTTPGDTQPSPDPSPDPTPTTPECVAPLPDDMTVAGTWNTDCTSVVSAPSGSGDRYARFYTFTLNEAATVTVTLESSADTYLYLREGSGRDGTELLCENDDYSTPVNGTSCSNINFNLNAQYDSGMLASLGAGTYTIEATTYAAGTTGSFTLTVTAVPVSDTPPPVPPPTPDPTPDDPTSPIPAGCTLQTFSGTSDNDSWTSGCVSRNRTVNGTHYAKFFSFSVSRSATYDLTLESRTDTYLILLDDEGDIIDENDDYDDSVFDLRSRSSGIRIPLVPGNYIVEATTYAGTATGDFTLTIIRPELAALHALYNATGGANWTNSDNWLSDTPLSDWHGIKTDDDGRVTEIYLIGNNLSGQIPAALGKLNHLEGLYLARNDLSGSIPTELGDLSSLRTLMLFDNELTGTIPPPARQSRVPRRNTPRPQPTKRSHPHRARQSGKPQKAPPHRQRTERQHTRIAGQPSPTYANSQSPQTT